MNGFHENILLDAVLGDEPIDCDVAGLANTMAPVLGLLVHGGVPISVVENNIAGPSQIETDTAWPGAGNKAQDPGVVVESLDDGLPEFGLGAAIEADVVELEHVEHFLEDVEHLGHLGEDQSLLSPVLDRFEQEHHLDQLSTVVEDDALVREVQQESRPDSFQFDWDYFSSPAPQVVQSVDFSLHLRAHGESSQDGRWRHNSRHHE